MTRPPINIAHKFFLEKTEFPRVWKITGVFPTKNIYLERLITSPKRKPPILQILEFAKEEMIQEAILK